MATHNYNLIRKFPSRVVRLDQGRLTETPADESFWTMVENQGNKDIII
jgi:ABC-type arginine transport system ATPase subunit